MIAREGWGYIAALAGVTTLTAWLYPWLALLPGALLLLVTWFFRDPERTSAGAESDVLAPADGRVLWVRTVPESRFVGGEAVAISIFLSVFDVHINRAPVSGRVAYRDYARGQFLAAWGERIEEVNERAYLGIENGGHRVLVVQIAGLLARRIVTWPRVGDRVGRGERFGLIKFGSCTQVYLPRGSKALVKPGDRVSGGLTIVGRLPE